MCLSKIFSKIFPNSTDIIEESEELLKETGEKTLEELLPLNYEQQPGPQGIQGIQGIPRSYWRDRSYGSYWPYWS
jgi:hypothetical protein